MDLSQIILDSVSTIAVALVAYLVHFGAQFIKNILLKYKVADFVREAEQTFASGLGEDKYKFVADKIVAFAASKLHWKLTEDQVKTLIEATVNEFFAKVKEEIATPAEAVKPEAKAETTETK